MLRKRGPLGKRSARWAVVGLSMLLLGATTMAHAESPGAAGSQQRQDVTPATSLDEAKRLNEEVVRLYKAGRYREAIPLAQRALRIREQALGPQHPDTAISLNSLALLYADTGDYAQAAPLYQRALRIREQALGPQHPDTAISLNNLAALYRRTGDYAQAAPLHQRALRIREQALGPQHPDTAISLNNLTTLFAAQRDLTQAIAYQVRADEVHERNIALNLATGSERQKLLYLATLSGQAQVTVSLHVESAPDDLVARRLALTTVLRRKGRALDAMLESLATVRRQLDPQDLALLEQLTTTRARLATLVLRGPSTVDKGQYRTIIESLEKQIDQLEADLSRRSATFRVETQPVTIDAIQAVIPPEAVLVEFVRFDTFDFQKGRFLSPRYAAYILHHTGEPTWVKLGEAQDIEAAAQAMLAALRDPSNREVKKLARALDEKLMQPVRPLLGEQRLVLLSPDGLLHLLPFAALVDEQERYLVEKYHCTYLTTGRDLLRLQVQAPPTQGAVVLANPAFDALPVAGQTPRVETVAKRGAVDFTQLVFTPLPETAPEAQALKTLLPDATVLTQADATKSALKDRTTPRILTYRHARLLFPRCGPPPSATVQPWPGDQRRAA